jgi:demethylspheroidene O-methyltransferase
VATGEAGAVGPADTAPSGGRLRDAFRAWRSRVVARPAFQRWATAFPLTRPIVRRESRALFDLCAGFVYSQVLLACVRLRLFDTLADGPRTLPQLAGDLGLDEAHARCLLEAAAALRLADRRSDGRYGLGDLGAALRANPGIAEMVEHHALLYDDLRDPVALLRDPGAETRLSRLWAYARNPASGALGAEDVSAYTRLMAASNALVAEEVLDAVAIDRYRCLLDVGGGSGGFLIACARRAPELRLMLFDLPAVAHQARARLAAAGLASRATAVGGDFRVDPLPRGADVVSVVRVLYDHDDATALAILRAARAALPEGGTVLVAEPMAGMRGAEAMGGAYFGFYLLAMRGGRARTPEQIGLLLREAGFQRPRPVPTRLPIQTGLVRAEASPPAPAKPLLR